MHKASIKRVRPIGLNLPMETLKTWQGSLEMDRLEADGKWHHVSFPNSVLLGGLQYLAKLLYRIDPKVNVKTFETDLYSGSVGNEKAEIVLDPENPLPYVQGYNLCIDGSQGDGVKPYPRHQLGYTFDTLIPFRMIPESENDFAVYRTQYLHHRIVELDGIRYVQYFTKKANIQYKAKLDDDTDIPHHPNDNLVTNKDSRLIAEFNINLTDDELQEWFRLTKQGGAASTRFSSVLTMIGSKATWNAPDGGHYDSMTDSVVFSRCNFASIGLGHTGSIYLRYKMLHI